jgi:hypothetical protein
MSHLGVEEQAILMRIDLLHFSRNLRRSPASATATILTLSLRGILSASVNRFVLRPSFAKGAVT